MSFVSGLKLFLKRELNKTPSNLTALPSPWIPTHPSCKNNTQANIDSAHPSLPMQIGKEVDYVNLLMDDNACKIVNYTCEIQNDHQLHILIGNKSRRRSLFIAFLQEFSNHNAPGERLKSWNLSLRELKMVSSLLNVSVSTIKRWMNSSLKEVITHEKRNIVYEWLKKKLHIELDASSVSDTANSVGPIHKMSPASLERIGITSAEIKVLCQMTNLTNSQIRYIITRSLAPNAPIQSVTRRKVLKYLFSSNWKEEGLIHQGELINYPQKVESQRQMILNLQKETGLSKQQVRLLVRYHREPKGKLTEATRAIVQNAIQKFGPSIPEELLGRIQVMTNLSKRQIQNLISRLIDLPSQITAEKKQFIHNWYSVHILGRSVPKENNEYLSQDSISIYPTNSNYSNHLELNSSQSEVIKKRKIIRDDLLYLAKATQLSIAQVRRQLYSIQNPRRRMLLKDKEFIAKFLSENYDLPRNEAITTLHEQLNLSKLQISEFIRYKIRVIHSGRSKSNPIDDYFLAYIHKKAKIST